ncbi:MAG: hypothetical protein AAF999_18780 [Pseudomonadota bacterium]
MNLKAAIPALLVLLGACGTVLEEQRRTAVLPDGYYRGEPYDIVTQIIQGQNGTYTRTRVVYWARSAPCIADSPGDCEAAARRLIDQRFFVGGF